MNKLIISITLIAALVLNACSKEKFEYNIYKPTITDIDSIYFSAGDISLIADGQAQLKFIVETYKRIKRDNATDTLIFLDYKKLPEGSLKIFESVTGKEVGMTYSTNSIPQDTLRFYAKLGSAQSETRKVYLRPKPVLPPKLYVDVIFHVWELNPSHPTYDVSSYQEIGYQQIIDGLNIMNQVVNNQIGTSPNGASANIEFRLAAKNPSGQNLAQPGYNKIVYSDNVKANPLVSSISLSDFVQFVNKTPLSYIWTPEKYLNIHVLPSGSGTVVGNLYPPKQLAPSSGQTMIPGITGIAANTSDYIRDFINATVYMPRTLFFPGYERKIELFGFVGNFYGLYPTSSYSAARTHSDYCFDTQEYNLSDVRNNLVSPIKVSVQNIKFYTEYATDDTRFPGSRNSITLDQVNRMRAVLARCPGRMNSY